MIGKLGKCISFWEMMDLKVRTRVLVGVKLGGF